MATLTTGEAGVAVSSTKPLPRLQDTLKTDESTQLTFEVIVAKAQLIPYEYLRTEEFLAYGQIWQLWLRTEAKSPMEAKQVLRGLLKLKKNGPKPVPSWSVTFNIQCGPSDAAGHWFTFACSELTKGQGRAATDCPVVETLDGNEVPVTVALKVPWSDLPPAFAASGDLCMELDSGSKLTAHSAFMAHASSILAEAIKLAPKPADGQKLRVPVKGVSNGQMVLLLQVAYCRRPESWVLRQSIEDMEKLAAVAHRLDAADVLKLVDDAFILKCGAAEHPTAQPKPFTNTCLTTANVASLFTLAEDFQLQGLSEECAAFLARNFQDVPQEQLPAGFDPKVTLLLKHFRRAYKYTEKKFGAEASWKAVA